jgi:hypothetical protein
MANLGTLYAQIGMDTSLLRRNAGEAQSILTGAVNSMKGILAGLAGALGVGLGMAGLVAVIKSSVSAYSEAESSLKRLSISVESTGASWKAAKDGIIGYAQEMQKTTRFSDEEVQASLSRVINLTGNVAESFRITTLATDLAAAGFGGLEETTSLLSRAMSGNTMMLERQLPILKDMFKALGENATGAQKAEVAFRYLNERFGGSAQKDLLTFAGAMQSLKNWVDEIKEAFGGVIAIQLLPRIREWKDAIIEFIESGNIVKWVEGVGGAITLIGGTIINFIGYVASFFRSVGLGLKDFVDGLEDNSGRIKAALGPPSPTLWQEFVSFMTTVGNDIWEVIKLLARSITNTFAGLLKFLLHDFGWNLAKGFKELWMGIGAGMTLDFSEMQRRFANFGGFLDQYWKDAGATGAAMIDSYGKAWSDMVDGIKGKSEEIKEIFGPPKPSWFELLPSFKGLGEGLGAGVKEKKITVPEMDLGIFKSSIDLQVSGYKDLLDNAKKTKADLTAVWENYSSARIEQIKMEGEEMFKQGAPIELILQLSRLRIADLAKEHQGLLDNTTATKELLDTSVGLYQQILGSDATSIETKKALWEDYKNVRFLQIEAEAAKLQELGVSQSLIDATALAEKAEVLAQEGELYAEHSEFVRGLYQGLYQGIGDFAGNMVRGMFDSTKSFYDNLKSAVNSFGDFLINLLGSLVATWVTNHLIEIGLFKGKEMAKTAIMAQEIAKRQAMESAASFLGPFGTIAGLFSLAFSRGGLIPALQTGGMITGGVWGRDSVPIMAMPGEFMFKQPSVQKIGIPALEYMNQTGRIPGGGETNIRVEMGDFNFNGTSRRDALIFPLEFKDKVLEVFNELVKQRKLEI